MMEDLIEKVEEILDLARSAGADAAEAFVIDAPEDAVSFEPVEKSGPPVPRTALTVPKRGLGLAARWGKRVGFASSTDVNPPALSRLVEEARGAAVPEDPPLPLTPPAGAGLAPGVPGLVDKRLVEMNLADLAKVGREVIAETREAGARVLEATCRASCRRQAVGNSLGLQRSSLDTRIDAAVSAVSPGGGLAGHARSSRSLHDLGSLRVGAEAAALAKASDGARDVVPGRQVVVLRPDAVLSLLATSLGPALGADSVAEGASAYKRSSLGRLVAAPILSITDDARRPSASGSYDFDAEGVAGRTTSVIEAGRLISFLHGNRTAASWGLPSTGNASRDRTERMTTFVEPSGVFGYRPGVKPSNLVVRAPGATYPSLEAAGVDAGLLVSDVMGAFVIDPAVGDFSVTTTNAWVLERGRSAYPVKRAMLSGNVYALLKQVRGLVEAPEDVAGAFSLLSPSWIVTDLTVI